MAEHAAADSMPHVERPGWLCSGFDIQGGYVLTLSAKPKVEVEVLHLRSMLGFSASAELRCCKGCASSRGMWGSVVQCGHSIRLESGIWGAASLGRHSAHCSHMPTAADLRAASGDQRFWAGTVATAADLKGASEGQAPALHPVCLKGDCCAASPARALCSEG